MLPKRLQFISYCKYQNNALVHSILISKKFNEHKPRLSIRRGPSEAAVGASPAEAGLVEAEAVVEEAVVEEAVEMEAAAQEEKIAEQQSKQWIEKRKINKRIESYK